MNQRISVVMTTYNGAQFLREQLDSLFNQTRKMDELIVYDDASDDDSVAILRQYQQRYPGIMKIFIQKRRVGYIRNFADALKMADGELIFLCDQDDIWEMDKIAYMSTWMEAHPQVACLNCAADYIDEHGRLLKQPPQKNMTVDEFTPIAFAEILYHNISMGCTMAFHQALRDRYLQTSTFHCAHDWELNMIAAIDDSLYYLNRPLICYRIHAGNTTGNDRLKKNNRRLSAQREKNARTMLDFIHACHDYAGLMNDDQIERVQRWTQFYEHRYALLHDHQKRAWFYCAARLRHYHQVVSYRGIAADLLYACKHNKLEKQP